MITVFGILESILRYLIHETKFGSRIQKLKIVRLFKHFLSWIGYFLSGNQNNALNHPIKAEIESVIDRLEGSMSDIVHDIDHRIHKLCSLRYTI